MFLSDLFEAKRNLVVIYGGRFQPFHLGHKAVYEYLVKNYGRDAVWITTSNKQELPKSPFSFADKAYFMQMQGIPMDRVAETTQPYRAPELIQQFDPANTVLLIALSEKDMAEDPRFKTGYKKDGNPTYFQPMPKDLSQAASLNQHGYLVVVPTVTFKVLGQPMRSATEVRAQYAQADQATRKKIIADLFGKYTPEAEQIMSAKLTEDTMQHCVHGKVDEAQVNELDVKNTLGFIKKAHSGQMYGDKPYWNHPRLVAATGKKFFGNKFTNDAIKVAFLHDVVEDTNFSIDQLAKMGYPLEVVQAVGLLTKNKALSYADNIKAIINSGNRLAMMVKYADNYQNFTGDKSNFDPERAARLQKKYLGSLNMLGDKLGVAKHLAEPRPVTVGECAGVGVIADRKQAHDPRYQMSLTQDVRPDTMDKQKAAFFPTRYPGKSK